MAFVLLSLSARAALAENGDPARLVPPHAGICEHPKITVVDGFARYESDPYSRSYERQCILRSESFALRRGGELRLSFGIGTTRVYRDNQSSEVCEKAGRRYESCKRYMLFDFFPEHDLFLVNIGYYESQVWLLVRQVNGKEETIVAPPRY